MATNRKRINGRFVHVAVAAGTSSGDPIAVSNMTGVAIIDRDSTTGKATLDLEGVYDLSVEAANDSGGSAVAVGDAIYYESGGSPVLNKKASGMLFGFALETITSGSTATIEVLQVNAMGPGTVDIPAGVVDTSELAADAVTGAKIEDDAVDSEHIAAGAIDLEHMSANSVDSDQYVDGSIDNAHLAANSVDSDNYVDGSIDKEHLAGGFMNVTLVAGGAAGNHTVTGITASDEVVFVGHLSTAAAIATLADLTSEFTPGVDLINNDGGTDTTNDQLMVIWLDLTA